MAVPARESAAAEDPARPGGKETEGWGGAHRAVIAEARLAGSVVAELGRDPGNGAALAMARLVLEALGAVGEIARGHAVDEAVMAARERRAYAKGVADCKAARCRLAAVPDAG